MRLGPIALALIVISILMGCDNPARVARREVDRLTRLALVTDTRMQRIAQKALDTAAEEEGAALGRRLGEIGCPQSAIREPESAPEGCQQVMVEGTRKYEIRAQGILSMATKANEHMQALWSGLRGIVELLEDIDLARDSRAPLVARLVALVAQLPELERMVLVAYDAIRTLGGTK